MPRARVAIVAASPLVGAGIAAALDGEPVDASVVPLDAIGWTNDAPDVVVVAAGAALPAAAACDRLAGCSRLLLIGDGLHTLAVRAAADRRVFGVLSASASAAQLRAAVTALLADLQVSDIESRSDAPGEPPAEPLTPRELEVFELVAKGLRNRDIAAALGISAHTAKFHVGQILAKVGAATRAEAVSIGVRLGLIGV